MADKNQEGCEIIFNPAGVLRRVTLVSLVENLLPDGTKLPEEIKADINKVDDEIMKTL